MIEEKLKRYADLIERYHETLDLVSQRALGEIATLIAEARQYAEVIAQVAGSEVTIVDVGSGVGLPGIVLAVTLPGSTVHLVERRRRRAAFLDTVVGQLGLRNARVWSADVKDLDGMCADVVTAQAVASLAAIAKMTRHLHRDPCYLVSRRGRDWLAELDPLREVLASTEGRPSTAPRAAEVEADTAGADTAAALAVAAERRLGRDGSLVALRLRGGKACPSSG